MEGQQKENSNESRVMWWVEEVYDNLDYYLETEEGRKKLEEIAKSEAERLITEISRVYKPQRDIIWLSRWCTRCEYFTLNKKKHWCAKHNARLVKPFFGKPIWSIKPEEDDYSKAVILDIDWSKMSRVVKDYIVEAAIDMINAGRPYYCYEPSEDYLKEVEEDIG